MNTKNSIANEIKKFTIENNLPLDKLYYNSMSSVLQSILWGAMTYKKRPKQILKDLKDRNLSLKDIKIKQYYGNSFKYKIKSFVVYCFKFKVVFKTCCFLYRVFSK